MTMNPDLFYAILAMDSYNRGYGTGVGGLYSAAGTRIGNASIRGDAVTLLSQGDAENADFYAIAYNLYGQTVISYRGSDYVNSNGINLYARDIWQGWTNAAGFPFGVAANDNGCIAQEQAA